MANKLFFKKKNILKLQPMSIYGYQSRLVTERTAIKKKLGGMQ